jgi:hypothetical protein
MKEIAQRLGEVERSLAAKKGKFDLFALFLRHDAPDVWDLVVAAKWIDVDRPAALKEITKHVQTALRADITKLSRVSIVDRDSAAARAVASAVDVEHGLAEVRNGNFFGLNIDHAYFITSRVQRAA